MYVEICGIKSVFLAWLMFGNRLMVEVNCDQGGTNFTCNEESLNPKQYPHGLLVGDYKSVCLSFQYHDKLALCSCHKIIPMEMTWIDKQLMVQTFELCQWVQHKWWL